MTCGANPDSVGFFSFSISLRSTPLKSSEQYQGGIRANLAWSCFSFTFKVLIVNLVHKPLQKIQKIKKKKTNCIQKLVN